MFQNFSIAKYWNEYKLVINFYYQKFVQKLNSSKQSRSMFGKTKKNIIYNKLGCKNYVITTTELNEYFRRYLENIRIRTKLHGLTHKRAL